MHSQCLKVRVSAADYWLLMVHAQVLMAGPDDLSHPINKKAKCWLYLRDLQEECGLTDAALEHIALVCGPRSA